MKTKISALSFTILALLVSLFCSQGLNAQTKAKIENVDFFAESNRIIITYDINGSGSGETFNIWILVKTASGKILSARTTSGDIGKGIQGGPGKRIEWSYSADNIVIEEDIGIEVLASLEAAAKKTEEVVQPVKEPEKEPAKEPQKKEEPVQQQYTGKKVSMGAALAMSAVLPGLGKTYAKKKGAAYLWGVVGYGMVAGSVVLNHAAYNNLETYRESSAADRDDYYDKAKLQAIGSYVLIGSAAIIWVTEFISTGVNAGKAKKRQGSVRLNGGFDDRFGVPVVGLTYKF
ncbi:MAG TPA: hypothetical protein PLR01_11330 [Bacteroidales bacterium]|nr:hypothetical protein [Bacteroidales bacterium]